MIDDRRCLVWQMDILQEWFESGEGLQSTGLFCHDVPEHLPTLDHSDGSTNTASRTFPLLPHATTPTGPPTDGTGAGASNLLRSHSVDEIHHLSSNQLSQSSSGELPCIPRCESYRCQSVFPALSCSTADTSHVEIAFEVPRYLLQEDEALVEEAGASEEIATPNKTSNTAHKTSASLVTPHITIVPHKTSSTCNSPLVHKTSTVLTKASLANPLTSGIVTVEPLLTVQKDHLHGNPLHHRQSSNSQSVGKSGSLRVEEDAPRVSASWSCDSHLTPPAPLTVCFPQVHHSRTNQLVEGTRLVSLNVTPVNIAPHIHNSCEKKKRRHGGGWPKGKSRKLDTHLTLPKPPATGYNIFVSEKRKCVTEEQGASSMSAVSKVMGQMWSQLSGDEKACYYGQAEKERQRYLTEMRTYFAEFYKGMSDAELEEVDSVLIASTALENNDEALRCQICQISFTSLNNKRSHFSGRLHRQALIEHLHNKLASSTNSAHSLMNTSLANIVVISPADTDGGCSQGDMGGDTECCDLTEQLRHIAMQHKESSEQLSKVKEYYSHLIETNADLQQQINELEYMEVVEEAMLTSTTSEGQLTSSAIHSLSQMLASLGEGAGHTAPRGTSTGGSSRQPTGQASPVDKDHASLS